MDDMSAYRTSPHPLAKLAPRAPWWRIAWAWCRGVFKLRLWVEAEFHDTESLHASVVLRARQRLHERHAAYLRRRYSDQIALAVKLARGTGYPVPDRIGDAAVLRLARAGAFWPFPLAAEQVVATWADAPVPTATSVPLPGPPTQVRR